MHPIRQIPRPQFVFAASGPRRRYCGYCGQEYGRAPGVPAGGLHHLNEDGSGQVDAEMDLDHLPRDENDTFNED